MRWWKIVLLGAIGTWVFAFQLQWGLLYATGGRDDRMVILYPVGLALNALAIVAGIVGFIGSFFGRGRGATHLWAVRGATLVGVLASPILLWFGATPLIWIGVWPL